MMRVMTFDEMEEAVNEVLTAETIRKFLEIAGLDVTAASWSCPRFAIVAGRVYRPMHEPGFMLVDGSPEYSAAWL